MAPEEEHKEAQNVAQAHFPTIYGRNISGKALCSNIEGEVISRLRGGEHLESKLQARRMEIDIQVREEENGFRIVFVKSSRLGTKRNEYVARSLEEFFTPAAIDAAKKLE